MTEALRGVGFASRISAFSRSPDHPHGQSLPVARHAVRNGSHTGRTQIAARCQNLGRLCDGRGPAHLRLRLSDSGGFVHQLEQNQRYRVRTRECRLGRFIDCYLRSWLEPGRSGAVGQPQALVPKRMARSDPCLRHLRRDGADADLTPISIDFSVLSGQWRILPFFV